jgi:anti-sigma factor RsiW
MPTDEDRTNPCAHGLELDAFLYVSGELDDEKAATFEKRLGGDQAAREAVCQAVQLVQTLGEATPVGPHPAYRARVRQRLQARPSVWQAFSRPRLYRGHPALWSALGAAAAVLLMLGLDRPFGSTVPAKTSPVPRADFTQELRPTPSPEWPVSSPTAEMATVWAELTNNERLGSTLEKENQRKIRLAKADGYRTRLLGNSTPREE